MNIFGEAINAFLSGVFRYSPGFSRYWPFFYCVSGYVAVVLQPGFLADVADCGRRCQFD